MTTLVGAHRHALDVFGDGGPGHFLHRPVVAEVDDFGPLGLQKPAHDVDGGIVPVEQTGGGDESDRMTRLMELRHDRARPAGPVDRVTGVPMARDYYNVLLNVEGPGARGHSFVRQTGALDWGEGSEGARPGVGRPYGRHRSTGLTLHPNHPVDDPQ